MELYPENVLSGGVLIGSGVVEIACSTLTRQSFGASGMRWKFKGTKGVINM